MIELLVQMALAATAGVLLNLTPCVLPVIPVKVRTIVNHSGASFGERVLAAAAFLAGTLLFFLVLGALSAAFHWTWGTLFRSPMIVAVLVAILAGAGVMTFTNIRLPVPGFALRIGGGRFFEPFSSGALAAILSTPCTGPFLGGVLAFALARPPMEIMAIFLSIGFGLGMPYVIILLRPDLLRMLPKGGEWSERLRQALAFILFAGAVFFSQSLLPADFGRWLWWIWAGALVAWTGIVLLRARSTAPKLVAMAFSLAAVSGAYAGGLMVREAPAPLGWQPYAAVQLAAARGVDRPVLLEFTAAWCINCRILEETVYTSPEVARAARTVRLVALQVDLTKPDPALEGLLEHYGGAGLPFAVLIDGNGKTFRTYSGLFSASDLTKSIYQTVKTSNLRETS